MQTRSIAFAVESARNHWTEVLLPCAIFATVGITLLGGMAWGFPVALALVIAEGAAIFHFAPRYRALRADGETWQERAEEVRDELLRFRERALHEDHETGLGNSRQLEIDFTKGVARFRRQGESFALVLVELRHSLGKEAIDLDMITGVAGVILHSSRAEDSVCRVGARQFAILLSASDTAGGRHFIQRVRVRANTELFHKGGAMTFLELVGGAATWRDEMETLVALEAAVEQDFRRFETDYERQVGEFQGRAG